MYTGKCSGRKARFISRQNQEMDVGKLPGYKNTITDSRFRSKWPMTKYEYLKTAFVSRHFS
jgi:hypothetical protein